MILYINVVVFVLVGFYCDIGVFGRYRDGFLLVFGFIIVGVDVVVFWDIGDDFVNIFIVFYGCVVIF